MTFKQYHSQGGTKMWRRHQYKRYNSESSLRRNLSDQESEIYELTSRVKVLEKNDKDFLAAAEFTHTEVADLYKQVHLLKKVLKAGGFEFSIDNLEDAESILRGY